MPVKVAAKRQIKLIREIFDDWLTRAAGIVCLLIVVIVLFNMNSDMAEQYPLLGTLVFAMVPVLFIAGGVIFIVAILKISEQTRLPKSLEDSGEGKNNGTA